MGRPSQVFFDIGIGMLLAVLFLSAGAFYIFMGLN